MCKLQNGKFFVGTARGVQQVSLFSLLLRQSSNYAALGKKDWPACEDLAVGDKNFTIETLVNRDRIMFPPLYIKLGVMKQFVKALDKHGNCFNYIVKKFSSLSMEKLKAGIFDGPQIRKLIQDQAFTSHMTALESAAWCSYVSVVREFLDNT